MEELNLIELFRYYLKRLPIIILTIILAILVGYLYIEYYQVPKYHASTTIILVHKNEDNSNSTITQNELTINEKLVKTYSEIIKSRSVLEQVINDLELKMTTDELEDEIEVKSISDTAILKVTVSNKNNELAVIIANKLAEVFKNEITKIYNLENISIIDEAIKEEEPYNINVVKQLIIYSLIGGLFSCGIIFIVYYFDNTIKSKKEIELKLNLPVLGEVPQADNLNKKQKIITKKPKNEDKIPINTEEKKQEVVKPKTKVTKKTTNTKSTRTTNKRVKKESSK